MTTENEAKEEDSTVKEAVGVERLIIFLRQQWNDSLAKSIWEDLTLLGRCTIWLPIWLLCWLSLPIMLPIVAIVAAAFWVVDRPLTAIGKAFFK